MDAIRTMPILVDDDPDLRATLADVQSVKQLLSPICYHEGKPLSALTLHRTAYAAVSGMLSSQMTCTAIRQVAAAYSSAKSNRKPATRAFGFHRKAALFLVGSRGRDARFCPDGTISIWTVAGRKRIGFRVPEPFRERFDAAVEIDSLLIREVNGELKASVCLTINVPEPVGIHPVGIDLNETNAIVAVDPDGNEFFYTGKDHRVRTRRTQKTRARLQRKLATRKAQKQDTRSIRRLLKRQGRVQRNRTRTFCQTAAKRLVQWAPEHSVLVLEDLRLPRMRKGKTRSVALRRRINQWPHALMGACIEHAAEMVGHTVARVNPYRTSRDCCRCGLPGVRSRHRFTCPHCGFTCQADVGAATNIRNRYTASRGRGVQSTTPEAQDSLEPVGKLSSLGDSR